MEEVKEWICPFYHRIVDSDECYDLHFIAIRAVKDESLVKEEDRDKLAAVCDKCKKHGIIEGGKKH